MPDITIPAAARFAAVRAINRQIDIHGETRLGYLVYEALAAAAPHIAAQALRDAAEAFYGPDGPRGEVGPAVWLRGRADQIEADHG